MTSNPPRYEPESQPSLDSTYILKYRKPVLCHNLKRRAFWIERYRCCVRRTYFNGLCVSTIFLGLDCGSMSGEPKFFETMIFPTDDYDYQTRCSTWRQALAMHWRAVEYIKKGINND